MIKETPLYNLLSDHYELERSSFHTPGHKYGGFFPLDLLRLDYTELPETDSLYEASGIILESEKLLTRLFHSKRTMISSGGCTLAIQAMLKLAREKGNKMLFGRNSHRSAVNTAALLGISPVWIMPQGDGKFTGRIMPENVYSALSQDSDICAVYITSPTYYGEISDIATIAKICHEYGVLLLVDNAHGSHLAFMSKNLHPINLGADISACSMHKTMPVLTGGAVLNIGNENLIENAKSAMSLFGSTSPSYPIMCSLELCADYMMNRGGIEEYIKCERRVAKIKKLAQEKGIKQPDGVCDPLRICLNTASVGLVGNEQLDYFRGNNIDCEFCDGENAVLICSPFNTGEDFDRIENAIEDMPQKTPKLREHNISIPKTAMPIREAMLSNNEFVSINDSNGRIAADTACPCPPGIPVIMPGEIIDKNIIDCLKSCGIDKIKCVR